MESVRQAMLRFFQDHQFERALPLALELTRSDESNYYPWYVAGQCYWFQNDFDRAVFCLKEAGTRKPDEAAVFLALGIALQLGNDLDNSVHTLKHAIELDDDYVLAYNSLGLTLKKMKQFDIALDAYDAGAKALTRSIVKTFTNSPSSPIVEYRETRGRLWAERVMYAALYLVAQDDSVETLAWPTGEQAAEEKRHRRHAGLYWQDTKDLEGKAARQFLPNFFNTFNKALRSDSHYSNLLGNRGSVLEMVGRAEEAELHLREAEEFLPETV